MKRWVGLAISAGLALQLRAEPLLTDIATFEALVLDGSSGPTLAAGGPWVWQDQASQFMDGNILGTGRTLVVKCRNALNETIFGAVLENVTLEVPPSPFEPPNPSGYGSLTFYVDGDMIQVYLNQQYTVGTMVLQPAEDDPVVQEVALDIKPGSAVNPFNMKSKGVLPVAVLGAADLDVGQIVRTSLKLAGVAPVRVSFADVQGDGLRDLVMHFRDQAMAAALAGVKDGQVVTLELEGALLDGTPIHGADTVRVILKGGKK